MRDVPAIIYTATDLEVAKLATERALHELRFAEQREEKTAKKAAEARSASDKAATVAAKVKAESDAKRLEAGKALRAERAQYATRGPKAKAWGQRLAELGLSQRVAYDLMALAGYVEEHEVSEPKTSGSETTPLPTRREVNAARREEAADDELEITVDEPTGEPANDNAPREPRQDRSGGRGKPEWLMRALVRDYSMPGDMVCDPLAGWGSTLRAALDEGRRAVGSEIDPKVSAEAGELPIRHGDWKSALADVLEVDAIIVDPPYSARTHAASRKFGNAREDGSPLDGLGPEYAAWTRDHVFEFVRHWSPRCRGWMVALTDHNLIHDWQDAYEEQGRYSFAPVVCVIRGMTVRLCGDGPSSMAIYAMVARPRDYARWRTLTGAYVGSRERLEIGSES